MRIFMKKKNLLSTILLILSALLLSGAAWFSYQKSRMDSTGHIPDPATEYLITQYADATGVQGTFYTISNDDTLIIIDGGWAGNADAVRKVIAKHNNTVDAWIISHPHQDHAGAFNVIYANPGDITIKNIYDNGFDYDFIEAAGEPYDDITVMETFHALTKDADNLIHLKRGDVITLAGHLTLSVFNAWDESVLSTVGDEKDYQNSLHCCNSSLCNTSAGRCAVFQETERSRQGRRAGSYRNHYYRYSLHYHDSSECSFCKLSSVSLGCVGGQSRLKVFHAGIC